jgi:hypothetical protein
MERYHSVILKTPHSGGNRKQASVPTGGNNFSSYVRVTVLNWWNATKLE